MPRTWRTAARVGGGDASADAREHVFAASPSRCPLPRPVNLEPRTSNRKPQTANRKPQTANREPRTANYDRKPNQAASFAAASSTCLREIASSSSSVSA
ncbi:RNA-binding domain protein [Burkholderia pseudomallei MSHR5596]|nr:RNA-binding domain protein [Burkholderia pseudomallei MSHR5596]